MSSLASIDQTTGGHGGKRRDYLPAGRPLPAPRPPPRILSRRPRRRHPSTSPARAAWPTGCCATTRASPSPPTSRAGSISSASTSSGASSFQERFLARAMGLWADPQRLVVATLFQVWRFENVLGPAYNSPGSDRHYVPRVAHTTGDIDIHDIGVMADGRIVFVNTLYSCLATLSQTHSFRPFWQPPFISKLAAEDRCHLNGLAMRDGAPAYVTATSRSDVVNGWRNRRAEGGCIVDVASNAVVTEKLSMPHSPRWFGGALWVLNSGTGDLGTVDLGSGASPRAPSAPASCAGSRSTMATPSSACRYRAMDRSRAPPRRRTQEARRRSVVRRTDRQPVVRRYRRVDPARRRRHRVVRRRRPPGRPPPDSDRLPQRGSP